MLLGNQDTKLSNELIPAVYYSTKQNRHKSNPVLGLFIIMYSLMFKKEDSIFIRGQHYWDQALNRRHTWSKIWGNSFQTLNPGPKDDVYFKLCHDALPTGERLERCKAIARHSRKCFNCSLPMETPLHLFVECTFARELWSHYIGIFRSYNPNITPTDAMLQYKFPRDSHIRKLLCTISTQILYEIWTSRNLRRKEGVPQDIKRSTHKINARIRIIHMAFQATSSDYEKVLCLPSPICTETGNELTFTLPELSDATT